MKFNIMKPMRMPVAYSAAELRRWHIEEEYHPGKWRPTRSCGYSRPWLSLEGWRTRFVLAWRVFIDKNDCVYWGEKCGEWKNNDIKYRDITEKGFGKITP